MAKERKLKPMGHAVKCALVGFLTPKLAADGKLQTGELDSLLKKITPGKYSAQINGIVGTVKDHFSKRLAADASLEDLPEILEALKAAEEEGEGEGEGYEEDGLGNLPKPAEVPVGDADDEPGAELMEILGKYEIPTEDLEVINDLITKMSTKPAADDDMDADAKPPVFPAKKREEAMPVPQLTPQAMDAAIKKSQEETQKIIGAKFTAREEVKPYIGDVDALSFDSADAIYKLALDSQNIDTKDVHPSAFRTMLKLMNRPGEVQKVAADAAVVTKLSEKYPNAPKVN